MAVDVQKLGQHEEKMSKVSERIDEGMVVVDSEEHAVDLREAYDGSRGYFSWAGIFHIPLGEGRFVLPR